MRSAGGKACLPPRFTFTAEHADITYTGVATILSGGALFLAKKVDDLFLVVALKDHLNSLKNFFKNWLGVHFVSWGCT